MIVCFGIVFPVLYFIFGKKHGVGKAIHYIVNNNREFIMKYTVDRLMEHVKKSTGIADRVDATISKAGILSVLPVYLKKLDTMPRPMRMIFRMLINKIDLGGMLTGIIEGQEGGDDAPIRFDTIARVARDKTGDVIQEKLLAPNLLWFAILLGVNLAIFALLKIVI